MKISRSSLCALVLVVGFFALAFFLTRHEDERDKQAEYDRSCVELFDMVAAESPLMHFGPEDVEVSHKWSILVGIHPAVTFNCRFDSPQKVFDRAVLYYRIQGTYSWMAVDTRTRRDNSARVVLRDLHRDTTYECFFILVGDNCIVKSKVVVFKT
jgi:hypothetical protein